MAFANIDISTFYETNEALSQEVSALMPEEEEYYDAMESAKEISMVGAGIGGGFNNTHELHALKCDEAMKGPDEEQWRKAVKEECDNLMKHDVFKVVPHEDVPEDAKILSSTWAMKKKSNG